MTARKLWKHLLAWSVALAVIALYGWAIFDLPYRFTFSVGMTSFGLGMAALITAMIAAETS